MKFTVRGGNAGSKIILTEKNVSDGIIEVEVDYKLAQKEIPQAFVVETSTPCIEVYSTWSPAMIRDRLIGKNYDYRRTGSRIAVWMPVQSLISCRGDNKVCVAVSDAATPIEIASGIAEEDAEIKWMITFFTSPTTAISDYKATIRIDTREIPFYDSIYDVAKWWEDECGYTPAPVPEHARLPMNSLWYSFHQVLVPDEIVRQCELSKPLGMESVIIDDGWQTNDSNRGYAFCGDWEPVRMPDMKGLVDRIHNVGMKVMIWYSVPFIGRYAKRYDEFKDFILNPDSKDNVYCLDPRYSHIREYLIQSYATAVKEWGLDGLKLDFIDSFALTPHSIKPDPRRDYESLEDAIDALMIGVMEKLREINPDIMIEFRQSYVGPSIRKYGNMLRVMDCPGDAQFNCRGVVDLRLTSGRTAVHSDMLMWNVTDTKESVACQLAAVIYGVPQISMKIDALPKDHYDTLKYYLSFWRENREVLLDGKLTAKNPESYYSQVCSCLDGKAVIAVYSDAVVSGEYQKLAVVNAGAREAVYLKGMSGKSYRTVDCTGKETSRGVVLADICEIAVSAGGMIFVG
ncbi:MAG: alpha-galactosidase [Ruminococcaceae bacterium]|nr:alpha-galactosidase [Oscillospiraceae bacterium]